MEPGFLQAMGLRRVAGRWFDPVRDAPSGAVVVNEACARRLGGKKLVGQPLPDLPRPGRFAKWEPVIVGVVQDFHYRGVQRAIGPTVLELQDSHRGDHYLIVRLAPGRLETGLAAVQQAWRRVAGEAPFIYHLLGERLGTYNADTARWTRLVRGSALLTLLIAGLSVFGLARLEADRRTREIGLRKVLGASVPQIVRLLVGRFSRLMLLANLFAWPVAYLAMWTWLQGFAYHVALGPQYFLLAGLVGLIIAGVTATWHAVRAALANPADTLRHE